MDSLFAPRSAFPDNLETAFEGIDILLLFSYAGCVHTHRTTIYCIAIDVARCAGVKHIFYPFLSFVLPNEDTARAEVMDAHLNTNAHLRKLCEVDPIFFWTSI